MPVHAMLLTIPIFLSRAASWGVMKSCITILFPWGIPKPYIANT